MKLARRLRYVDAYKCAANDSAAGAELSCRSAIRVLRCGILPLLAATSWTVALADEPEGVATQLIAEVRESTRTPEGREAYRFLPATLLRQGEVVYYTVRIENPTQATISDVEVTQRVPANTTYVPGSASGPAAEVFLSVDGATFEPETTRKAKAAGLVESPAASYAYIRWRLRYPLAPGAVALARFQAVFN